MGTAGRQNLKVIFTALELKMLERIFSWLRIRQKITMIACSVAVHLLTLS
ncbi:hypothetical protein CPter91_2839 [Collimonas pratensis]|uniref:Uncharacterized protein n=1 Tax=Collimonas pratensis TaxID=279113 RepID=A0A127Q5U6_9BURK|nr:hypothetical protein CPter91_2839 [Collimonas pratensis]